MQDVVVDVDIVGDAVDDGSVVLEAYVCSSFLQIRCRVSMTHFVGRGWVRVFSIQKSPGHIDPRCRGIQNESRVGIGLIMLLLLLKTAFGHISVFCSWVPPCWKSGLSGLCTELWDANAGI